MMRRLSLFLFLTGGLFGQTQKPQTLKDVLLEQLRTTDDKEDWFVPITIAVDGVSAEQAKWTDGHGNHSIGQLVAHLAFWNERNLLQFQGKAPLAYSGNNDETFNSFDEKSWSATVKKLNTVMKNWEQAVRDADDSKLKTEANRIAHIGTHNAYHVGQIIYLRKLQGSWDPSKGVK